MANFLKCSNFYVSTIATSPVSNSSTKQKPNIRFKCLTCNIFICKVCAEKCHRNEGHEVVFHGRTEFDCLCGIGSCTDCNSTTPSEETPTSTATTTKSSISTCKALENCKYKIEMEVEDELFNSKLCDQEWCSYMLTGTYSVFQELYECFTCGMKNVCVVCAQSCHKNHHLSSQTKIKHSICDCGSGKCSTSSHSTCLHLKSKQRIESLPKMGQHSCVVSPKTHSLFVWAGAFDFVLCDMYEYSFVEKQWYKFVQRGDVPGIRSAHSACAVPQESCFYIFGGVCGSEKYNQLYRFCFKTHCWTKLQPSGTPPLPKYFTTLSYYQHALYIMGGMTSDDSGCNTMHRYDIKSNSWNEVQVQGKLPPQLNGCSAVVYRDHLYIFAGFNHNNSKFSNSLYAFNFKTNQWKQIKQSTNGEELVCPFRRAYHTAVLYNHCMYIYGGKKPTPSNNSQQTPNAATSPQGNLAVASSSTFLPSLSTTPLAISENRKEHVYKFDFAELKWTELSINEEIENVFFHQAVVYGNSMFVIGGNDRNNNHFKFFEFDLKKEKWMIPTMDYRIILSRKLLKKLFIDTSYFDVIIKVQMQEFKVHSSIISQCKMLKELLLQQTKNCSEEKSVIQLELHQIHPDVLYCILLYLYGSEKLELRNNSSLIVDLMQICKEMELEPLYKKCLFILEDYVTVENVVTVIQKSYTAKLNQVKLFCLQFINDNYDEIIHREEMESLSAAVLLEIARARSPMIDQQRSSTPIIVEENSKEEEEEEQIVQQQEPKYAYCYLLDHLQQLRLSEEFSNITLLCNGKSFKVHKEILASQCEYFAKLFSGNFEESFSNTITMEHISEKVLALILDFVYMGNLSLELDSQSVDLMQILELAKAADMLLFRELEEITSKVIKTKIQPNNVIELLHWSGTCESKLKQVIKQRSKEILMQMKQDQVVELLIDTFQNGNVLE